MCADTDMLRVERDADLLRLVLNRPARRNALHPDQWRG
jgi:enoyl-CoA hydratase/carnithine racemase